MNSFSCIQNLFLEISGEDACVGRALEKHLVLHFGAAKGDPSTSPKASEVF